MEAIDRLLESPLGRTFLASCAASGLRASELNDPLVTSQVMGYSLADVSVWAGPSHHDRVFTQLERLLPAIRSWAERHATPDITERWFPSGELASQVWIPKQQEELRPAQPVIPDREPTNWERYAQKPAWGLYTSSAFGSLSTFMVIASHSMGDLGPIHFPAPRYLLTPSADARIFRVNKADDWLHLCVTYPAPEPGGLFYNRLAPDFAKVAAEWDAVHLSFGGLLASDQVVRSSGGSSTELLGWDAELTVWLRWKFAGVGRLPDLTEPIPFREDLVSGWFGEWSEERER